ncbi:unnamed protein product [Bursaphelenchus okinawaensis]|uniref:Metalloprotease TIKI homolog n=1 Tax=Bursaphelenchus okinawaensis TaxID=465554 RepID=A0A811KHX5_9BILA|nr:unnamed protein product [Bursaphelenchus okinawaensis]CAG9103431.1 unnamed protein product [Bursaphelenchus okinawaensis]
MVLYSIVVTFLLINTVFCDDQCNNHKSTFLWSITWPKTNTRNFMFGTIHVAFDQVWDSVSSKVKQTLDQVEGVVFELALHDPDTVTGLIACKQLEYGQSLKGILPPALFQRLRHYIRRKKQRLIRKAESRESRKELWNHLNSLIGSWEYRRPIWLLFLLYQLNEQENHSHKENSLVPMLDAYLAHSAKDKGKKLYSIESPREQCNPLIRVNKQQVIFAINYTLSYMEWAEATKQKAHTSTIDQLIQMYKCGDEKVTNFESNSFTDHGFTLNEKHDQMAKDIDQKLKYDIIEHRNMRMALRTHQLIQQHPDETFLFAIGAGHFYGPYSLISMLESYGYIVEKVNDDTDISNFFYRPNNFKTFNELWVRNAKDINIMSIRDKDTTTSISYLYFILCLVPVVLIVCRNLGKYYLLKSQATEL